MPKDVMGRLNALTVELTHLGYIGSCLSWDQETVMPPKAAEGRAAQMSLLSGLLHDRLVSNEMGDAIEAAFQQNSSLSPQEQANVREMRRAYLREKKMPAELVKELAHATSMGHHAWVDARKNSDFAGFAPTLEKIFGLKRQEAEAVGYEGHIYNALVDTYEPGMTVERLDPMFAKLREDVVPIVKAIASAPKQPQAELLTRQVAADKQREFGLSVAVDMGFDLEAGMLAISAHPFCNTLGTFDVRMTTRYNEVEPMSSFFGVMHETGHALYEQGLDPKYAGTPMAQAISLGIHESQSRTWENMVGRGLPFWKHYFPKLQKSFAPVYDNAKLDDFYFAVNMVRPSLIRVEADEVTYNLHILLRYEMERDFFSGKISVNDLPKVWNSKMQEYLGITPPDDAHGVLQDVHWSAGLIGYFATYTLGNLYGAQIHATARKAIPDLDAHIEKGDLMTLREWLRTNVHMHGSRFWPADLVKEISGQAPDSSHYVTYLNEKFGPLYGIHGGVGAR